MGNFKGCNRGISRYCSVLAQLARDEIDEELARKLSFCPQAARNDVLAIPPAGPA